MKGKERCRILKEIRAKIAEENGIEFAVSECTHKGDCLGSCPKCEWEVRYLERQLELKRSLGKRVAVAGIAAGITLSSAGCSYIEEKVNENTLQGDMQVEVVEGLIAEKEEIFTETIGELPEEEEKEELIITGEIAFPEEVELMGEPVAPFIPSTPEEFEGYGEYFIAESLTGHTIEEITALWGEADMNQKKEGESVSSYFTESYDIVLYYNSETDIITKAELIEND